MKTLSLKVLGCAATLSLLTITRAQTSDDAQTVPPPDTNVQQQTDVAMPAMQEAAPVIIMPVQTDNAAEANGNVEQPQPENGQNAQPMQGAQPVQNFQQMQSTQPNVYQSNQRNEQNQFRQNGQNQFQNRGGNNNFGRNRGNRDFGGQQQQQQQRFTTSTGDPSMFMPPSTAGTNGTGGLILNFRGASIEQVLNYLSDAAGFIIELDTRVTGTIDVWSAHPVSKEEAVQLLNSVLSRNGYAVIQSGRTLRIMNHDDALHSQIPVIIGNDPDQIPQTDVVVTQIIPIRYVSARQLITDLSPLTSPRATIIANDAGNSIIVTDTQENIHHLVELVKAIDGSAEDVTEVKPFALRYHDPVEVANLITTVFADQSGQNGGGQASPIRFGGFGGFGGGGGGGRAAGFQRFFGGGGGGRGQQGGQQGGAQTDRVRQRAKVVAVADQRTQSVIVTAPKDIMAQVEELVTQVDRESPKVARVSVIHLENADPQEVQKALQSFASSNGRTSQGQQNSILTTRANQALTSGGSTFGTSGVGGGGGGFGGGGFGGGGGGGGIGGGRGGFGGQ